MNLNQLCAARQAYPSQFWLLFVGMLISRMGASMIWPFLMIFISGRLDLPLVRVTSLMTLNAAMGLLASFVAGPIADRMGRKGVMVVSLTVSGLGYLLMIGADSFLAFALVMALRGMFDPLFQVGSDAMLADMIQPEKRNDAYALIRLAQNLGLALGPAVGGFLASISYAITFSLAAAGMIIFGLLVLFFAQETLPKKALPGEREKEPLGGYLQIAKDRHFLAFVLAFTLVMVSATIIWVLMAVYAKENYGLPESQYGLIPMTNAIMVVTLQIWVTRHCKRYRPLWVMAVGALLYGGGVGSVALAQDFWGFWTSMVIVTWGELILVPAATTYAANLAPVDMRGRYMGIYGLTWGIASAIGPVFGGWLNDNMGPWAMWCGGGVFGLLSVLAFTALARRAQQAAVPVEL